MTKKDLLVASDPLLSKLQSCNSWCEAVLTALRREQIPHPANPGTATTNSRNRSPSTVNDLYSFPSRLTGIARRRGHAVKSIATPQAGNGNLKFTGLLGDVRSLFPSISHGTKVLLIHCLDNQRKCRASAQLKPRRTRTILASPISAQGSNCVYPMP
jgi:hypothetical protein